MRAPGSFAVAVRRRDGSILVRERAMSSEKTGLGRIPLLRGVASLVGSLRLGSEALRFSAEQLERDLLAEEERPPRAPMAAMLTLAEIGRATSELQSP